MKKVLLIVGASGSGKTTIADKLSEMYNLKVLPSYTTRPKRYKDETGHTFVSKEEFDKLTDVVAYLKRYDAEYCATAQQIEDYDLYVVNPEAAINLKEKYKGSKKIEIVYIETSVEARYKNMISRGDNCRSAIKRIIRDIKPYSDFKHKADYIIENEMNTNLDLLCKVLFFDVYHDELGSDAFGD